MKGEPPWMGRPDDARIAWVQPEIEEMVGNLGPFRYDAMFGHPLLSSTPIDNDHQMWIQGPKEAVTCRNERGNPRGLSNSGRREISTSAAIASAVSCSDWEAIFLQALDFTEAERPAQATSHNGSLLLAEDSASPDKRSYPPVSRGRHP